jgi:hypothetical protein
VAEPQRETRPVAVPPLPALPAPLPKPTWASPENNGSGPPRAKRKFGVEEDLVENGEAKRLRPEGT